MRGEGVFGVSFFKIDRRQGYGHYLKKMGGQFLLYDDNDKPIYSFGMRGLSSDRTKRVIQTKTGADLGTLDTAFAKLVEHSFNRKNLS